MPAAPDAVTRWRSQAGAVVVLAPAVTGSLRFGEAALRLLLGGSPVGLGPVGSILVGLALPELLVVVVVGHNVSFAVLSCRDPVEALT